MTIDRVLAAGPALCLGIDPHPSLLADWALPDDGAGLREFGLLAAEAARDAGVVVIKPQVAFYERHGAPGIAALGDVIAAARAAGLWVIADAKRGDIGSTMAGYADAWLAPGAPLESDALTVSPYLGVGALEPALAAANAHGRIAFVLVATSNPEARTVQRAVIGSAKSVAAEILDDVRDRNAAAGPGLGPLGAVIGATLDPVQAGLDLARATGVPILAPGFGAQGAELADVRGIFGPAADRVIANVSRDALRVGPAALADRLRELAAELALGAAA